MQKVYIQVLMFLILIFAPNSFAQNKDSDRKLVPFGTYNPNPYNAESVEDERGQKLNIITNKQYVDAQPIEIPENASYNIYNPYDAEIRVIQKWGREIKEHFISNRKYMDGSYDPEMESEEPEIIVKGPRHFVRAYGVTPFSKWDVSGSDVYSDISIGLASEYSYKFREKIFLLGYFHFFTRSFQDIDGRTYEDQSSTVFSFMGGAGYQLNKRWNLRGLIGFEQELFFQADDNTKANTIKTTPLTFKIEAEYHFWDFKVLSFYATPKLNYIMSSEVDGVDTNAGLGLGLRIHATAPLANKYNVFAGGELLRNSRGTSQFDQTHINLNFFLGIQSHF